jgi:hypothetical protein
VLTARTAAGAFLFRDRIYTQLRGDPELYAWVLARHFVRHLQPFAAASWRRTS